MERNNLWAPWRMEYIRQIDKGAGCFLCGYVEQPDSDDENFVLWRTEHAIVVFNRYPYNNGHLLIAPKKHIADFNDCTDEEMLELTKLVRDSQQVLSAAIEPAGFNIGMNFGRCAGAGLPDHLHIHVVPRWDGDTNYMHVCSDTDVISQSMTELFGQLRQMSDQRKLPCL